MKKDDFEDFKRYEAYQREKELAFARGFGNFLYRYIMYSFIWLLSAADIAFFLTYILGLSQTPSMLLGMVSAFFVFKIWYVKANPFKSFIITMFIAGILSIAVS